MRAAESRRSNAIAGIGAVGDASNIGTRVKEFGGEKFGGDTGLGGRDFAQLMQERADAAQMEWNTLRDNLLKAQADLKKINEEIKAAADKAAASAADTQAKIATERIASLRQQIESGNKLFLADQEAQKKARQQALEADAKNWADRAESAREALRQQIESGNKLFLAEQEKNRKLTVEAKAFNRELAQLWNGVSDRAGQAFADILVDGTNSFRSLAREITKSIVEIAARMAIINPILNAVFGSFGGFTKLPTFGTKVAAAGGGTFVTSGPTNFTVGDNPGGVELVSVLPLSGVGRSSINGRNVAMAGGGSAMVGGMGGGDVFNFAYTFNGGVSREEVLGMLPMIVETSKGAVLEAQRRRRDGFRR